MTETGTGCGRQKGLVYQGLLPHVFLWFMVTLGQLALKNMH